MEKICCPAHPGAPLTKAVQGEDQAWGYEGKFSYSRCSICQTLVLNPRPSENEIGHFYGRYYDKEMCRAYSKAYDEMKAEHAGLLDFLRALEYIKDQKETGQAFDGDWKVLDVGSGTGGFIRFLNQMTGVKVQGVDFDPACSRMARKLHNVDVASGELKDQKYEDNSFDLVTCCHCLEHVYEPGEELEEIARIMKPGGWLHVEVPTPGLLFAVFRGRWAFLQPPTHLYHYKPKMLKELVAKQGFRVKKILRPWLPGELAFSLLQFMGLKGVIPLIVLPAKKRSERMLKLLFVVFLAIDLPITFLLAFFQLGGNLKVLAQKTD